MARLCASLNSKLSEVPNLNQNELYVAMLPDGMKDPFDFVHFAGGRTKARDWFWQEILRKAIPWDEWYIVWLLSKHNPDIKDGTPRSFSEVYKEASTFL